MLNGAEVLTVHNISAVLIFHNRQQITWAIFFFNQINFIRFWMAHHTATAR